jgi:hypothetical protein
MKIKKLIFIYVLIIGSISFILPNSDYFQIFTNSSTGSYYQYGKNSYFEYFLNEKFKFKEKEYFGRVRQYSWGTIDTTYFRRGEKFFCRYNTKTKLESIELPITPTKNQKWKEADGSWQYQILKVNCEFKAVKKTFKNCILVECKQVTNKDKDKSTIYYLYYSKNLGYVGNSTKNGKVLSYLKERKKNSQQGDIIGK